MWRWYPVFKNAAPDVRQLFELPVRFLICVYLCFWHFGDGRNASGMTLFILPNKVLLCVFSQANCIFLSIVIYKFMKLKTNQDKDELARLKWGHWFLYFLLKKKRKNVAFHYLFIYKHTKKVYMQGVQNVITPR